MKDWTIPKRQVPFCPLGRSGEAFYSTNNSWKDMRQENLTISQNSDLTTFDHMQIWSAREAGE